MERTQHKSPAEEAFTKKWEALGGAPDDPRQPRPEGLMSREGVHLRHYAKGTMYRQGGASEAFFLNLATQQPSLDPELRHYELWFEEIPLRAALYREFRATS